MPVAVLTVAVAPVAVAVGYGRGAFGPPEVIRTAQAVAAFAPLIVLLMCYAPLTGALNARRRGGVLLAAGLLSVCLNFVLDVILGIWLGAAGVALSSSVTAMLVLAFFSWRLSLSETAFTLAPILSTLLRSTLASLPVAIPIAALSWSGMVPSGTLIGLAALLIFGILGILGYVIVAASLGLDEARELRQLGIEWNARRRRAAGASR
jgi:putative peptidoglycan lipid II flippase